MFKKIRKYIKTSYHTKPYLKKIEYVIFWIVMVGLTSVLVYTYFVILSQNLNSHQQRSYTVAAHHITRLKDRHYARVDRCNKLKSKRVEH